MRVPGHAWGSTAVNRDAQVLEKQPPEHSPGTEAVPAERPPAGPVRQCRAFLALSSVLGLALATEVWLRIGILPWFRPGTPTWYRVWNREVRDWGSRTARLAMLFTGVHLDIRGNIPDSGRFLVVANHQSSIDIPFLIHLLRPLNLKFVAHDGLKRLKPAVSLGLRAGGSVFIGKRNAREDLRALKRFAAVLPEMEGSPVIFPEGFRTHDGVLEPFQIAGMRTLREATGLPILPVAHDGLWRARTVRGTPQMVGTTLRFHVLDPIPAERFEAEPRHVYQEVEAMIRQAVLEMRGEPSNRS